MNRSIDAIHSHYFLYSTILYSIIIIIIVVAMFYYCSVIEVEVV